MKKTILLLGVAVLSTGCLFTDDEHKTEIYTTSYPITFITEELLGDNAVITSIYPSDADVNDYELTEKQVETYSETDLFIYNGLTGEKNIARDFVNKNDNILLIDAANSLTIEYSIEELWLSPNNYLMLSQNIKDNLTDYIENRFLSDNVYLIEDIETNFEELEEALSFMDANLRKLGQNAIDKNFSTIVVSSDSFKFLENYGFTVISLEDNSYNTEDSIKTIQNNFENNKYIALINEFENTNETVNSIKNDITIDLININNLNVADSEVDYLNLMNEFIANLSNLINE